MLAGLLVRLAAAALLVVAAVAGDGRPVLADYEAQDGPAARDYVDILTVPPGPPAPAAGPDAATGSWTSPCGRNEIGHHNADNVVGLPGQPGAALHIHDYVGNVSTNADSTDLDLALAGTTCRNGDTSTYYWPVLRLLAGGAPAGTGTRPAPLLPASVLVQFRGNPHSKVVAMPRFLRLLTGDSKAVTKPAPTSTAPLWTCSGITDRHTTRYPLCPPGQRVLRIFDYPSCWDGLRTDSPNHRAHVVFPTANGACPGATFAIPQLRIEVGYAVPPGRTFAIDTFPDQHRSPVTDHSDFIDVMPDPLMAQVVGCLNAGRHC